MKRLCWALPLLLAGACAAPRAEAPVASASRTAAEPEMLSPEDAARVRGQAAQVLFWSQAQRDENFQAMEMLFPGRTVEAGASPRPLPQGTALEPVMGKATIDAFMEAANVAGLLVLQDGRVRLERYARAYGPNKRWTSFSVAKSLTSTLVGAAIKDGYIKSVEDPVTRYIPELEGSAYDGVTVHQVLTMTSGVRWNEDYTDPSSDVARMLVVPTPLGEDATVAYLRTLPREAEPGTKWVYKTGETNLIGVLVRKATGKRLSDYLSEKIWRPYGMERDAFWQIDASGQEIGGCCISASLRDYGRIGQFMLDGGVAGGRSVLPEDWIAEATRAQVPTGSPGGGYGYQWWTGPDDTYLAIGIFGQMVAIDPRRKLIVVTSSAWPQATGRELSALRLGLLGKVAAAVDRER